MKADLHRIESAPYPSSYAKERMREQIEALAQQGAPVVSSLIEHDREMFWGFRSWPRENLSPTYASPRTSRATVGLA